MYAPQFETHTHYFAPPPHSALRAPVPLLYSFCQQGIFARIGWFTFKIIADAFEGITYRELVNDQVTQYFKRPVPFTEYCTKFRTSDADYATSLCKYLYVTLDAAGRELAKKDWEMNIGSKFFFLPAALPTALQTAAILAGVTDIPSVKTVAAYRGFGEARTDKKAYIAEAPCSWTTYWPVQAPTVNVHVVQHTYGELVNLLDRTAYNLALVDRNKPMSAWKNDPNFMPIILWWWTPEPTLEKWRYAGDVWKMEVVRLGKWTDRCENARQAVFVPEYKDKTCGKVTPGHYNLTKDWQTECGQACKDAGCDYPDELPFKAVSSSIRDHNPDAFSMLGKVEVRSFLGLPKTWSNRDYHNAPGPRSLIAYRRFAMNPPTHAHHTRNALSYTCIHKLTHSLTHSASPVAPIAVHDI